VALLAAACGGSSEEAAADGAAGGDCPEMTLTMASTATPEHSYTPAAEEMISRVAERTGDRLTLEMAFGGVLGSEKEMTEQLQRGEVEMGWLSDIGMASVVPGIGFANLPYLFPDYDVVDEHYFGGFVGEEVKTRLSDEGIQVLGWIENDYRALTTGDTPVDSVEDLEGLKLRVPELPMFSDFFDKLGASPTPIAVTELLTALQQGTVDGQDNGIILTYSFGFFEAQGYFTDTRHSYSGGGIVVGDQVWSDLPAACQDILREEAERAGEAQREANRAQVDEFRQNMEDAGMEFVDLPDDEREKFIAVGREIWEDYSEQYGPDLMERINDELGGS
jgi:tripartite ATP-independent transporter DctP family solute receptor